MTASQEYAPRRDWGAVALGIVMKALPLAAFAAFAAYLLPWFGLAAAVLAVVSLAPRATRELRQPPPVRVGPLGVTFAGGDDGRLVPWESVTGVVLFDAPRTDTTRRSAGPALGLRLRGHPDGVSVHRSLHGWRLDRQALERSVAGFAQVPVVDGPAISPTAATERLAGGARPQPWGDARPPEPGAPPPPRPPDPYRAHEDGAPHTPEHPAGVQLVKTARYRAADAAAYQARFDLRSNLLLVGAMVAVQAFLWIWVVPQSPVPGLLAAVFTGGIGWLFVRPLLGGGATALAVDRPGVFFGESHSHGDDQTHRLVPWRDVSAVVVFDSLVSDDDSSSWRQAVGVRLKGDADTVRHWRVVDGWRFDRPALEAAVERFSPGTRVVDGIPQRPPRF